MYTEVSSNGDKHISSRDLWDELVRRQSQYEDIILDISDDSKAHGAKIEWKGVTKQERDMPFGTFDKRVSEIRSKIRRESSKHS